MFGFPELIVR